MALVIGSSGERYHFTVPHSGERFQVTRYGTLEKSNQFPTGQVDHVIVKDSASGYSIKADEEDAILIDSLCAALNAGEIPASVLDEKLNWYFTITSH